MWQGIIGHDDVVTRFRAIVASSRLASTYLFVGPEGIGKRSFALELAQGLLCQANGEANIDPCGSCLSCKRVRAGTHPDLDLVARPADKNAVPLEAFIGDKEHRHRQGLCHNLALKPQQSGRRVAIIDDADDLTQEAANCLLKTLEEPPPRSVLILLGTSAGRQLPTILSRCQVVRFSPLSCRQVADILLKRGSAADAERAHQLAAASDGSLARATELMDTGPWRFRCEFLDRLGKPEWDRVGLATLVAEFVNQAGREAAARRRRLRQVISFAVAFYREVMRTAVGVSISEDTDLRAAVARAAGHGPAAAELAATQVERCLLASVHVDRNLNQTTLLDCWLDDLHRIGLG